MNHTGCSLSSGIIFKTIGVRIKVQTRISRRASKFSVFFIKIEASKIVHSAKGVGTD